MKVTEENFPKIYEGKKNTVYAVAVSYLRNTDDAMDATQDVFIKLLNFTGEFQDEEHLKAWLIRVTINHCKNMLRSRKNAPVEITEDIPFPEKESEKGLIVYVMKLPEKYRIPLHLFYYENYSIKEIAEVLSVPEATVKVRLHRGRNILGSTLIREEWYD